MILEDVMQTSFHSACNRYRPRMRNWWNPRTFLEGVWAKDISYIPMARGFVSLAFPIDRHSREVIAWRLSISMDTAFCTERIH